ncbi:MAG TPA: adenylate kinase [Atribacteraceae bacterium]|nr:adenylate kinase [Atribacteraceae bacterium]
MRLILLGPPGVGKGTQAKMIETEFDTPQISTGDIIRNAMQNHTEWGKKAESYVKTGRLVPDDVVIGIVEERLSMSDVVDSFMLDGFPRTLEQAGALDRILTTSGKPIDAVIYFDVNRDAVVKRLSARRVCEKCQATYNLNSNPPREEGICDRDQGKLIQREDDKPEVVLQRLITYEKQTKPLIDFYEKRGIMHHIPSSGGIDQIFGVVKKLLCNLSQCLD